MLTTAHLVWRSVVNNSHIEYKKHAIFILFLTSGCWSILHLGCALKLPQVLVYCLLLALPYVLPFPLFLCLLNVHFLQSSRGKSQVFTEDTQLLVIKRPLHFAQQVQAPWSSCISLVTDNVLMWCSKSYLQYGLVWYYLLGDQNSLDAFCSWLYLQNTYCFLLCLLPQGERDASLLLYSNSRKNIKNFSSGQVRERSKPQGICQPYPSWMYGSTLLPTAAVQRTDGSQEWTVVQLCAI